MNYISETKGSFLLAGKGKCPKIYSAMNEAGILRAIADLCRDIEWVTGCKALITENKNEADIVISGAEETTHYEMNKGYHECFMIRTEGEQLCIYGADKRGVIYGIYDLCEKLGISPWYWWADVPPVKKEKGFVDLPEPYFSGEPSVKYRGIFINDEESMAAWALGKEDYDYVDTYKRIYELLLRLRGNILWPAMHACSPHFHKNPENARNADLYGIVIGTAHCEQMMRNNVSEYFPYEQNWVREHPDKKLYRKVLGDSPDPLAYVYTDVDPESGETVWNKEMIRDYWRDSLKEFGSYENMYTLGMRGLHDFPWQPVGASTPEEKARIIEEVIHDQREIIREYTGREPSEVPQLFLPYKEMQEIYNSGMKIPEDVTLMWSNDNYGYLRQLPTEAERSRSGGVGMYYHLCYCGCPKSYLWMSTTPFALIREELTKAYENGVDRIWIANAGDLKGAEQQIEYFLHLAWDVENEETLDQYAATRAQRDFALNAEEAREFAEVVLAFQRLAFARKPEFFERGMFALKDFNDEGQRYLERYEHLVSRSKILKAKIAPERYAAYFELHYYLLHACRSIARQYILMDEQQIHQQDGFKNAAWHYIYQSDEGYYDMVEDTRTYHRLFDGKWDHMMDSAYGECWEYSRNHQTLLEYQKEMGTEPGIGVTHEKMVFSGYTKDKRFLDIFNHYNGYAKWWIETEESWVLPEKEQGVAVADERIWIYIDYEKAPCGNLNTNLIIHSDQGDHIVVPLKIENIVKDLPDKTFAESCGYVSMFAAHYSRQRELDKAFWRTEPYLGREQDCLKLHKNGDTKQDVSSGPFAIVEYDILFTSVGTFRVDIYRLPTLDELGQVRFAIGLDENEPKTLQCTNQYVDFATSEDSWGQGVLRNSEVLHTEITVAHPGVHTLQLYGMDAGVMVEKIVIWTGEVRESYFGPNESYREI